MQQTVESAPSSASASFAGLLASLTAPQIRSAPAWNNDQFDDQLDNELAGDVATLSYERALRTHARYKPADPVQFAYQQAADSKPCQACGALTPHAAPGALPAPQPAKTGLEWSDEAEPKSASGLFASTDRNLKRASITIRLSKRECEQLRRRAAEAGLTVSAYLRSCTFEAEALRAQVKQALAELRTAPAGKNQSAPVLAHRSSILRWLLDWLLQVTPRWHPVQRVVRA